MVDFTHTSHHILDVSTGNPLQGVPQQSKGVNCGSLAAPSMWPAVCQDERWMGSQHVSAMAGNDGNGEYSDIFGRVKWGGEVEH